MSEDASLSLAERLERVEAAEQRLFHLVGQCAVVAHGLTLSVDLLQHYLAGIAKLQNLPPPERGLLDDVVAEAAKIGPLLQALSVDE